MSTKKKAVVIGGAGFLGRRVTALLCGEQGFRDGWPRFDEVLVLDKQPLERGADLQSAAKAYQIKVAVTEGDILNPEDLRRVCLGAHTVFHLASMVYVGLRRNPEVEAINVQGTWNVIEACRSSGVQALVYTSSEDVVLSGQPVRNGDESLPYPSQFLHDYVRTKVEGEQLALEANGEILKTCSLRPVHIYGPEDPHALVASLSAFAKGTVPFLLGGGQARFDIVYVDNVAHAHLLAAHHLAIGPRASAIEGQTFFIGEDNCPNFFDWLRPYATAKGIKMPRLRLPSPLVLSIARLMEVVHWISGIEVPFHSFHYQVLCKDFYFSNKKAERLLGYQPIVTQEEAKERTMEWLLKVEF